MVYHASTPYADFSMAYFYTIGTIYLFAFIFDNYKNKADLIIASLFLGLGIFVKRHGLYLAGIDLLVLVLTFYFNGQVDLKQKIRCFLIILFIITILALPWLIFNSSLINSVATTLTTPFSQSEIAKTAQLPPLAERISTAWPIFRDKMFFFGNWGLSWGLLLLSIIFFGRTIFRSNLKYLLVVIFLNLFYVFSAVTMTNAFNYLVDGTLMNRLMMYQMPLVIYFVALSWPKSDYPVNEPSVKKKTLKSKTTFLI
jgi:hypothetical protein